jgi:CubicO group peptidase (beta-lactamase class C family)
MSGQWKVSGSVASGYEPVSRAFADNFRAGLEVGATFVVMHRGSVVVDLWGGHCDADRSRPLGNDALFNVWSTTKGLSSICIALLVDRKALAYDDPVTRYWPEFGAHGKERVTVAQMMSHQAGVCGPAVAVTCEDYLHHEKIASMLAAQAPFFAPGTAWGYHALSFGNLVHELIRRVDGRTLSRFFAEEIAEPLQADAFIGLPQSEDHRQAAMLAAPAEKWDFVSPNPLAWRAAMENPTLDAEWPNRRAWRAAGMGGAGASANARGLARIYGALLWSRAPLISNNTLRAATVERVRGPNQISGLNGCYAAGFALNLDGLWGPSADAFGHGGWGGSVAFADPRREVVIAYAMNQMGNAGPNGDPRLASLIQASYASIASQ